MKWFVLLVPVLFFLLAAYVVSKRSRGTEGRISGSDREPISFRCPVAVKYQNPLGWSMKTLAGMEIIVRESTLQITQRTEWMGRLLGTNWNFDIRSTSMTWIADPSYFASGLGPWIALQYRGKNGRASALAVSSTEHLNEIWSALIESGVSRL